MKDTPLKLEAVSVNEKEDLTIKTPIEEQRKMGKTPQPKSQNNFKFNDYFKVHSSRIQISDFHANRQFLKYAKTYDSLAVPANIEKAKEHEVDHVLI